MTFVTVTKHTEMCYLLQLSFTLLLTLLPVRNGHMAPHRMSLVTCHTLDSFMQ